MKQKKKQKKQNKNMTHAKQESNKIFSQGRYKNKKKLLEEYVSKIGVEHIKSNEEFYLYLYSLGT